MRVLMLGPDPDLVTGGISNVVRNYMTAGLEQMVDLKYIRTMEVVDPGRQLYRKSTYLMGACRTIHNLLSKGSIDIVHQHVARGFGGFARDWFLARFVNQYKIPHIIHWHSSSFDEFLHNPLMRLGARQVLSQAAVSLALSKNMEFVLRSLALPNSINVRVVVNGVNLNEFLNCRNINRIQRGTKNILLMGNLSKRKGVYDLLKAIPDVKLVHPDVKLMLCGDGDVEIVNSLIRQNDLGSYVIAPGHIHHALRSEWYERADIFTLPSYGEGVPCSVLEAMAAEIPLVVSRVGGIPEIADSENALFVEPGNIAELTNQISNLLSNPELATRMGSAGFQRVQKSLSMEANLNLLLSCYNEVLQ